MPFSQEMRQQAGLTSEDEFKRQIQAWQQNPTKPATAQLLRALEPTIDKAIRAHTGQTNPLMRSRARMMALTALRRYDPQQARPSTYLFGQLQGLRRVARQQQQVISVPERVSLEQARLQRVRRDMLDELGRDPTDDEVADRLGVSIKRIRNLRTYGSPVAESQLQDPTGAGTMYRPAVQQQDNEAWLDLVRGDLDPVNQQIMDYTLGRHGYKPLSNQALAKQLRLSPGAISQRKAQIQGKLDMEQELSPFGAP